MLEKAIDEYEQGFRADLRDYYPGLNAVTLRLARGTKEDLEAFPSLISVVRYSIGAARTPKKQPRDMLADGD